MGFDKKLVYIWKIPAQFTRFLVIKIQSATKTRRNDSFKRRATYNFTTRMDKFPTFSSSEGVSARMRYVHFLLS